MAVENNVSIKSNSQQYSKDLRKTELQVDNKPSNDKGLSNAAKMAIGATALATIVLAGFATKGKLWGKVKNPELKIPNSIKKLMEGIDEKEIVTKRLQNGKSTITFSDGVNKNILVFDKSGKCTNILKRYGDNYDYIAISEGKPDTLLKQMKVTKSGEGRHIEIKNSVKKSVTDIDIMKDANNGRLDVSSNTYLSTGTENFRHMVQLKNDSVNIRQQRYKNANGEFVSKSFRDGVQVDKLTPEEGRMLYEL